MKTSEVARYYDRNTAKFLRLGASGPELAIHRGLWGPGVDSARAAAQYVHRLIAARAESLGGGAPERILDLGCGVGGTVLALARHYPRARLCGASISETQVDWARRLVARAGLADRCCFEQADFHDLRLDETFDLIVLLESLVHSPTPGRVLSEARRHLNAGGLVIVIDDFVADPPPPPGSRALSRLERFRQGWKVPGVQTPGVFCDLAKRAGLELVEDENLSSLVRTRRMRDRLVAWSAPVLDLLGGMRHPFAANVIGGNALRQGIEQGWMHYRMLCLRALPDPDATRVVE